LLKNFLFNFFKAILNFLRIIKFCPQVFPQNFCGFFGSTKLLIFFYNSFATVFVVLFVCFFSIFFLLVALAHGTWGRWPLAAGSGIAGWHHLLQKGMGARGDNKKGK
jgi:hypothetical protein